MERLLFLLAKVLTGDYMLLLFLSAKGGWYGSFKLYSEEKKRDFGDAGN